MPTAAADVLQLLGSSVFYDPELHGALSLRAQTTCSLSCRCHAGLASLSALMLQILAERPIVPAAAAEVLQLLGSSMFYDSELATELGRIVDAMLTWAQPGLAEASEASITTQAQVCQAQDHYPPVPRTSEHNAGQQRVLRP